jgi:predicted ArsR family transcriptional regulator
MKRNRLDKRFFDSTRGKLILLLRGSERTVDDLTKELGLTDNAVRSHLFTLERDGLITQSGVIKGFRKPHFAYSLTPEAEHLFPKPYDALFNQLLESLKGKVSSEALEDVLKEVGRRIAKARTDGLDDDAGIDKRLENALESLEELGGIAELVKDEKGAVIKSGGCPLSAAVVDHPEVCKLAEALIAEIVNAPVKENCDREKMPRCRFEISLLEM